MQRNIYLEGELGSKFGSKMSYNAPTVADAMKLLEVNNDNFREYLIQAHEKGVGFHIDVSGESLEYDEEVFLPLNEGDITITPVPAGAKGGAGKIFAAILIVILIAATGGFGGAAAGPGGLGGFFGTGATVMVGGVPTAVTGLAALNGWGMAAMMLASSLAMSGIGEIMAPDPATDADQQSSYLFNGSEKNVIEGDPVPVLYGKLKIPGQPVSFEITNVGPSANQSIGQQISQDVSGIYI